MRDKITISVIAGLLFSLGFTFCSASRLLMAQNPPSSSNPLGGNGPDITNAYGGILEPRKACVFAGRVMSLAGDRIPGAAVLVSSVLGGEYRVFQTDASGDFQTVYDMTDGYAADFKVWLTVRKKGFQTAQELIDYSEFAKQTRLPVTLRPEHPDPALLSQQELLSDLLPRLRSLGSSDGIAAKSEKKYSKGVPEFIDKHRPDRALNDLDDVVKRNPQCVKCRTMLALAELASGNWDGAARWVDSVVAPASKNKTGGSPEAMVLAGVMESWMGRPESAVAFFLDVISLEPENKLVLQELGRAYLQLGKYELAEDYLERSVAAGAGPEARLLRVQALLGEDEVDEANVEMDRYLNGRDVKKLPIEVRMLWAQVFERERVQTLYAKSRQADKKRVQTLYAESRQARKKTHEVASIDYLHDSAQQLQLNGIEPAKSQEDLKNILTAVGKEVTALFRDFKNSTSLETIRQEQLRHNGKVSGEIDEKFRYLCLMPDDPATPGFNEYRENVDPERGLPGGMGEGFMLTSGFVSAALIFHPEYQAGSQFRYLGRQIADGHQTHVIAFAQIPTKAKRYGYFISGEKSHPILEQGLAWIDTENYRVIRLRTNLLNPLPDIQVRKVTTQIDYQEVRLKQLVQSLWLPKDVTVTVDWRGKTLRNVHHYSDFKLFNVGTSQAIRSPKTAE
jgi:tetratricopeptide (TPR) repeat protein